MQVLKAAWRNPDIHAMQIHCWFLFGQSFPHGELLFELAAGEFWGTGPQLCSPLCVLLLWNFLPTLFPLRLSDLTDRVLMQQIWNMRGNRFESLIVLIYAFECICHFRYTMHSPLQCCVTNGCLNIFVADCLLFLQNLPKKTFKLEFLPTSNLSMRFLWPCKY